MPCKCWWRWLWRALIYHFCNGLRHLAWDMGWGFERADARRSAVLVVVVTLHRRRGLHLFHLSARRGRRMSLRTPLARALHHGTARDGVGHWLVQRVTASALAPLAIWLLVALLSTAGVPTMPTVTAWIAAG